MKYSRVDLDRMALYAAYRSSIHAGDEAYRKFCKGENVSSYYIKDGKNIRWYQKILLWIQGFSRIDDSTFYLRTGIFSNSKITLQKGKANFVAAHPITGSDSSKIDDLIQSILKRNELDDAKKNSISPREIDMTASSKIEKTQTAFDKEKVQDESSFSKVVFSDVAILNESQAITGKVKIGQNQAQFYALFGSHVESKELSQFLIKNIEQILNNLFSIDSSRKECLTPSEMEKKCAQIAIELDRALEKERSLSIPKIKELYNKIKESADSIEDQDIDLQKVIREDHNLMQAFLSISVEKEDISQENTDDLFNDTLFGSLQRLFNEKGKQCSEESLEEIDDIYGELEPNLFLFSSSPIALAIVYQGSIWTVDVGESRILAITDSTVEDAITDIDSQSSSSSASFKKRCEKQKEIIENDRLWGVLEIKRLIGSSYLPGFSLEIKVARFPIEKKTKLVIASGDIFQKQTSKEIGESIQQNKNLSNSELARRIAQEPNASISNQDIGAIVVDLMPESTK